MQVDDQKYDEEEVLELVTPGKPIHERRDHSDDDGKVQVGQRRGARLTLGKLAPHVDVEFVCQSFFQGGRCCISSGPLTLALVSTCVSVAVVILAKRGRLCVVQRSE